MSAESDIKKIIQLGLQRIQENPDALAQEMDANGVEDAVPAFIATIISSIVNSGVIEPSFEVIGGSMVGLFGTIDRMITEAGKPLSKEQKMSMLSTTMKLTLEMMPDHYETIIEQAGGAEELKRVGTSSEEEIDKELGLEPQAQEQETQGVL